jgi:thioesterase domain-containing protein
LIFVPPLGGIFPATAANEGLRLAALLDPEQPFYALQPPALAPTPDCIHPQRLMEIAAWAAGELAGVAGGGSAALAAFCGGSHLALALAGQMAQSQVRIRQLVLIDPLVPPVEALDSEESALQALAVFAAEELRGDWAGLDEQELLSHLRSLDWNGRWNHVAWELTRRGVAPPETRPEHLASLFEMKLANERAVIAVCKASQIPPYAGGATIIHSESGAYASVEDVRRYFSPYLQGEVRVRVVAGHHSNLFRPPQLAQLAEAVGEAL